MILGNCEIYREYYPADVFQDQSSYVYLDFYILSRYIGNDTELVLPSTAPDGLPIIGIGKWCFNQSESLEKIVIPDGYLSVGAWAFQNCPNLKEIHIGKDVYEFTSVEPFAFSNQLSVITVDPENSTYMSQNNCLLTKDGKTLVAGCKTSVIPDTVEVIGENAFCNIQSLSQITIPDSVTTIKDWAFSGCHQLTDIYLPNTITEIGCRAFHDCPILTVRCEAPERPAGWHEGWDGRNLGETTDRYPVPNVIWGAKPVS